MDGCVVMLLLLFCFALDIVALNRLLKHFALLFMSIQCELNIYVPVSISNRHTRSTGQVCRWTFSVGVGLFICTMDVAKRERIMEKCKISSYIIIPFADYPFSWNSFVECSLILVYPSLEIYLFH